MERADRRSAKHQNMLEAGQKIPIIAVADESGKAHSLRSHAGSWLVIWFYPKDFTTG